MTSHQGPRQFVPGIRTTILVTNTLALLFTITGITSGMPDLAIIGIALGISALAGTALAYFIPAATTDAPGQHAADPPAKTDRPFDPHTWPAGTWAGATAAIAGIIALIVK